MSILISSLLIFIYLSASTQRNQLTFLDVYLLNLSEQLSAPLFEDIFSFVTLFGSVELIAILSIFLLSFLLFKKKDFRMIAAFITIMAGSVLANFILKLVFQRERPGETSYFEVFGFTIELASYSFPSGHTMRACIFYGFLIYLIYHYQIYQSKGKQIAAASLFGLILAVGFSRVYLDAHFPSDIVAAFYASLALFMLFLLSIDRFKIREQDRTIIKNNENG
ncbi:phosphatase PAP2 family protein [Desertibacillus haloalkaliphilus]|nr:phosphatase PAP2 family protein [Desertibacillus haloalkaliphilus]